MKILIVDDDKDIIDIIVNFLELKYLPDKMKIYKATNGKDALNIALKEFPDLIITDLDMPVMDGASFIKELRKRYIEVPVLAISAHSVFKDNYKEYKANEFIKKPIDPDELYQKIETILKIV
ncbi:MAG TPA: response regulator [bacterium]|nr:response regulator [bacterium]HPQ19178.1 response regulator [bacterium]